MSLLERADPEAEAEPISYEAALHECAEGSNGAIARIYAAEAAPLRRAAQRIVRDRERAEDVIHDAFVQVLRDAAAFDPARGSARGWIYSIVRHTALKSRLRARVEVIDEDELSEALDRQVASIDGAAQLAGGADLRALLERLEPRKRACLIMALVDGRTHAEIADCLGLPIGTIKSWIRRELVALRRQLA